MRILDEVWEKHWSEMEGPIRLLGWVMKKGMNCRPRYYFANLALWTKKSIIELDHQSDSRSNSPRKPCPIPLQVLSNPWWSQSPISEFPNGGNSSLKKVDLDELIVKLSNLDETTRWGNEYSPRTGQSHPESAVPEQNDVNSETATGSSSTTSDGCRTGIRQPPNPWKKLRKLKDPGRGPFYITTTGRNLAVLKQRHNKDCMHFQKRPYHPCLFSVSCGALDPNPSFCPFV